MKLFYTLIVTVMFAGAFMLQPALAIESATTSVKQDNPLQAVHNNLVQAEHFLEKKQYADARHALTDAKKGLGDYKWLIHEDSQKEHVKTMEDEIGQLTEELKKEDPSTLDKATSKVKSWAAKVKKWLTSHPEPGHKPEHPYILKHEKDNTKQGQ